MRCEVVLAEIEVAGQPFDAGLQDARHAVGFRPGQRAVLRGRNPEPVERGRLVEQPAHETLVEDRRQLAVEDRALLLHRARLQQVAGIASVESRQQVAHADAAAEQPVAIEVARERFDPTPARDGAPLPIAARAEIEMRPDVLPVGGQVAAAVGRAEEAEERVVVGQVAQRAQLQPNERDMRAVEVDRRDAGRIGHQVVEDIAAAGADRQHVIGRADLHGLEVDRGILPDLRIDQAAKRQREDALEHAFARQHPVAVHRGGEPARGGALRGGSQMKHSGHPGDGMEAGAAVPAGLAKRFRLGESDDNRMNEPAAGACARSGLAPAPGGRCPRRGWCR